MQTPSVSRVTARYAPRSFASMANLLMGASFSPEAPSPCEIPIHDMRSLGNYQALLPVYENGSVVRHVPAYQDHQPYKTNYRLAEGDEVLLLEHAVVDGYWFEESTMSKGSWDNHVVLAGARGVVRTARTPWVSSPGGATRYFANVDVQMPDGSVSRVRVAHTALKKLSPRQRKCDA